MHQHTAVVGLLDEVGEHFFGHLEIGDDPVLHRFDGHHVSRRPAEHFLGLAAHCNNLSAVLVDGHNGRLVDDDPFASCIDQSVRGSQINRQV